MQISQMEEAGASWQLSLSMSDTTWGLSVYLLNTPSIQLLRPWAQQSLHTTPAT